MTDFATNPTRLRSTSNAGINWLRLSRYDHIVIDVAQDPTPLDFADLEHAATVHVVDNRLIGQTLARNLTRVPVFVVAALEQIEPTVDRWDADKFSVLDEALNGETVRLAYESAVAP